MRLLKKAVIKEEYVALTGDFIKAVILNQFVYWSQRTDDFDKYILEEKIRAESYGIESNTELLNGWIYKKCEELSDEIMIDIAPSNMRNHIKKLVEKGWLSERNNPYNKWDKTKQYRVNLIKIHMDLVELGYYLQEYKIDMSLIINSSNPHSDRIHESKTRDSETKIRCDETKIGTLDSEVRNNETVIRPSVSDIRNSETITRIPVSDNRNGEIKKAIPDNTIDNTIDTIIDITNTHSTYKDITSSINTRYTKPEEKIQDRSIHLSHDEINNAIQDRLIDKSINFSKPKNERVNKSNTSQKQLLANSKIPEDLNEVIRLSQSCTYEEPIRSFIENSIKELYLNAKLADTVDYSIQTIRDRLKSLNVSVIDKALYNYSDASKKTNIKIPHVYFATCLWSALMEQFLEQQGLGLCDDVLVTLDPDDFDNWPPKIQIDYYIDHNIDKSKIQNISEYALLAFGKAIETIDGKKFVIYWNNIKRKIDFLNIES